jgi:hypothetical protein
VVWSELERLSDHEGLAEHSGCPLPEAGQRRETASSEVPPSSREVPS